MINIEEIKQIHEEAKALKSEYIVVRDMSMIGTNQVMSYMRHKNIKLNCQYLSYNMKDMTDLLKQIAPTDEVIIYNNRIVIQDGGYIKKSISINNFIIDNKIIESFGRIFYKDYNYCVCNLSENEQFMEALNGKVADGLSIIVIRENNIQFPISVYGGLLPVNKGDTILARISYTIGEPTFLVKYEVCKKKGADISVFVRYLFI